MPILATIVLDSGAFLQNISKDPIELDVGYFQSDKDHDGNDVPDIRVYANAEELPVNHPKLGKGRISVIRTKAGASINGLMITDSLKQNLLRKVDLYGDPSPPWDLNGLECVIHFTSGTFRCSKVKDRRFEEVTIGSWQPTGGEQFTRPIAHDVLVHFDLEDDEELRIENEQGPVLFSTKDLAPGTRHVEIELLTNNATAKSFFCSALDLRGRKHCWLPNQGDPNTTGSP